MPPEPEASSNTNRVARQISDDLGAINDIADAIGRNPKDTEQVDVLKRRIGDVQRLIAEFFGTESEQAAPEAPKPSPEGMLAERYRLIEAKFERQLTAGEDARLATLDAQLNSMDEVEAAEELPASTPASRLEASLDRLERHVEALRGRPR
ncbi:MAG: hypothetical protein R2729_17250 [Bryobacteraceae bacterium]